MARSSDTSEKVALSKTLMDELIADVGKAVSVIKAFKDHDTKEAFPFPAAAVGPAGLLQAMQSIVEATEDKGSDSSGKYPCFVEPGLADSDFVLALINLIKMKRHYEAWFEPSAAISQMAGGGRAPQGSFCFTINALVEWGTRTPLPMKKVLCVRVLNLIYAALTTDMHLVSEFNSKKGFSLIIELLDSNYNKMQFCDFIMHISDDKACQKAMAKNAYLDIVRSFSSSDCKELKSFSLVVLEILTDRMKTKYIKEAVVTSSQGNKDNIVSDYIEKLVSSSLNQNQKLGICSSLTQYLYSEESLRDDFLKEKNIRRVLDFLMSPSREELQSVGTLDGHTDQWWTIAGVVGCIGAVAGGSEMRQRRLGEHRQLLPRLAQLLDWNDGDNSSYAMTNACVATMYKVSARVVKGNGYQLYSSERCLTNVMNYFDLTWANFTGTRYAKESAKEKVDIESNLQHSVACLQVIIGSLDASRNDKIVGSERDRIYKIFEKTLQVFESPLMMSSSPAAIAIFTAVLNFSISVTVMEHKTRLASLQWLLKCCLTRTNKQGLPYLTVLTDIMGNQHEITQINPAFCSQVSPMVKRQFDLLSHVLRGYAQLSSSLGKEDAENYEWVQAKISIGPLLSMFINQNSVSKPPSALEGFREINICKGPCCVNADNLQRCSRCKKVSYCSKECQKNHWVDHKRDCKKV